MQDHIDDGDMAYAQAQEREADALAAENQRLRQALGDLYCWAIAPYADDAPEWADVSTQAAEALDVPAVAQGQ